MQMQFKSYHDIENIKKRVDTIFTIKHTIYIYRKLPLTENLKCSYIYMYLFGIICSLQIVFIFRIKGTQFQKS